MILAACGGATPSAGPAEPPPIDDEPLSLGTASAESSVPCPAGAASGAKCTSLVIACPRLDALPVIVVTSAPPAATATATVLLHNYIGGTELLDDGFVDAYHAAKIGVVQVQWQSDWPASDHGVKHAACRYATLVRWIFEKVHAGDRTRGFCAQSFGGSGSGLAFSLTHYGMGDLLDAVTVSGGPP